MVSSATMTTAIELSEKIQELILGHYSQSGKSPDQHHHHSHHHFILFNKQKN
jgi:hypothetical protein